MAVTYRQIVLYPPSRAHAGQGWGVSYFPGGALVGVAPIHQDIRSRIGEDWTACCPSPAYVHYDLDGPFGVWWTSWAYLTPGRARIRLRATTFDDPEAQAELTITQYQPAGAKWLGTALATLTPTAGSAAVVGEEKATVDFPAAGWYLFAVAFHYQGTVRTSAPIRIALDWAYPGLTAWRPVEGYFLHPVYHYPGNWPAGAIGPLEGRDGT